MMHRIKWAETRHGTSYITLPLEPRDSDHYGRFLESIDEVPEPQAQLLQTYSGIKKEDLIQHITDIVG
jgi:hypothetical protein